MRTALLATTILSLAFASPVLAAPGTVPSAAAVVAAAPVPVGQLTDAVRPAAYRLDLTVDPAQERFSGRVEIEASLKSASAFVDLHGRDLAIRKAAAIVGGKEIAGRWTVLDTTGVARLTFAETLPAGAVTFIFEYDAPFENSPAGMFRVKVEDDWYSWTQFESIDGRAAFPSFDEPGFKTPFTVTLRTKPGQVAVSNAPEISKTLENGLEVHRFAPTLPLPTYLVAMMVGPFAVLEGAVPQTPQRSAPLPLRIVSTRQNADKLAFALEGSKGIVAHLEDYFGQPFPYPKLDQITTPILPGAMENAGADLYNDGILVMDDKASTDQKRTFGMVVSHELAHQWFGDLVTPAWWDDIWLNESFANWMGYRIGDQWRPDLNIKAGALDEGFTAMNTDALLAGRPIHQSITANAQIDEAFDSITYGKGGHVVAMIAAYMGDTKFRDGVRRYMAAHKYGNATSTDFFAAMAEAAGDPRIIPAMQSFTDQQGVPLVTFTGGKGGKYTVSQSRYVRLGTAAPATRWGIPLCMRRAAEARCELMTEATMPLLFKGKGPLVPNFGGTGYYRFELPQKDWDALISQADNLPGGEALALADSLLASFRAGRASAGQLAALARKLVNNPDSYASEAGIDGLEALDGAGMMDDAAKSAYRKFIAKLYRPRLAAMGFTPKADAYSGENPEKSQKRLQIVERLAGTARDSALRGQLAAAATAFLGGDKSALDPALYGAAFETWLTAGGLGAAKQLADRALASQDPLLRPAALAAVATSGDAAVAKWLLDDFKDDRLRRSERVGLVRGVIQTGATRDFGFEWLGRNFDALMSSGGGIFFAARLPAMLSGYCSAARADDIASLLRPRMTGKTGALELERTIERVRSCGVLKDARGREVSRDIAKLK
jgi:aminopeptidase N